MQRGRSLVNIALSQTGDLFNLDAMQSGKGKDNGKQADQQNILDASNAVDTLKASFSLPAAAESAIPMAVPKQHVSSAPKGKLKIVTKKSPKLGAKKIEAAPESAVPALELPMAVDSKLYPK